MDTRDEMESGIEVEAHPLSPETAKYYQELLSFLESAHESGPEFANSDEVLLAREWRDSLLKELSLINDSGESRHNPAIEPDAEYFRYSPGWRSTWREFRVQLEISQAFGRATADRLHLIVGNIVLHAMVWNRTPQFIARAPRTGLTWKRPPSRPFYPALPYASGPLTIAQQIVQEAVLIDAALTFALLAQGTQPGRRFVINAFRKPKNGNSWTLGSADRNHYPDYGHLHISLNALALEEAGLSDKRWAGIIAHEMLHNMGWGHPVGVYRMSMPIEIYEACVEERELSVTEEVDEH